MEIYIKMLPSKVKQMSHLWLLCSCFLMSGFKTDFTTLQPGLETSEAKTMLRTNVNATVHKLTDRFDTLSLSLSRSCSLNVWPGSWKPNDRLLPVSWRDASSALRLEAWLASGVFVCVSNTCQILFWTFYMCLSAVVLQVTGSPAGHFQDMLLEACRKSQFKNRLVWLLKSAKCVPTFILSYPHCWTAAYILLLFFFLHHFLTERSCKVVCYFKCLLLKPFQNQMSEWKSCRSVF